MQSHSAQTHQPIVAIAAMAATEAAVSGRYNNAEWILPLVNACGYCAAYRALLQMMSVKNYDEKIIFDLFLK